MRSSGITVYKTSSSFILHSFYTKKSMRFFQYQFYIQKTRSSSIHSTCRRQRDLLSSPQAFQFYKDISIIHDIPDIPDIPVIHDIPTLLALLHVPAPSSTNQYLPVLSSVFRDSTRSSISSIRIQFYTSIGLPETPLSTSRIQDILQTLHSSKKGRCCDIGHTFDIFYRIELQVKLTFSQSRINSFKRLVFKSY